jgi:phosphatidylinositol-3-phosphatase
MPGPRPRTVRNARRLRWRGRSGAIVALSLGLTLGACTTATPAPSGTASGGGVAQPSALPTPSGALPRPDHVVVVVFENTDAADVAGPNDAPYLSSLAERGAEFTNAHGETHPSQPNYLALFSGSTQGVVDDTCPVDLDGDNLARQLLDAGLTFSGYSEDLPHPGYSGCNHGGYARKHNPWVDFTDLPASVNQPFSAFPADYASLPTVSIVVPNLCNDMHDCGVATGDAWAQQNLGPYADWAATHNSLLIVTFDEDRGRLANHIATIVAGAGVADTTSDQRIDHYALLRTIEDMYGLAPLGDAAAARPLTGIWEP